MDIISIGISFIEILAIFLIYNVLINGAIFKGIIKKNYTFSSNYSYILTFYNII